MLISWGYFELSTLSVGWENKNYRDHNGNHYNDCPYNMDITRKWNVWQLEVCLWPLELLVNFVALCVYVNSEWVQEPYANFKEMHVLLLELAFSLQFPLIITVWICSLKHHVSWDERSQLQQSLKWYMWI
jgi:hypothetical protein